MLHNKQMFRSVKERYHDSNSFARLSSESLRAQAAGTKDDFISGPWMAGGTEVMDDFIHASGPEATA
jgi:hypothetical protein